ncbi:peptidylprolyl isomerase [Corallococcus macrosporus]|uniref:peptidylprolyl isomerase n=1 Tax=Myxococcus fulvus (strain ATCC BAA-855 / HW-1) TaxID=483219 RepID=F8C724_MYXFH|nr:peptidylprolyl isomerase [Corallococcus macrosporus]AEI68145.1 peptidyl-prolyl cis-trans isomerase [Corallococcus macrosporus]
MRRVHPVRHLFAWVLSLSLLSGCVRAVPPARPPPEDARTLTLIQDWEDARSLGDGALVSLAATAPDARVRARALRALARIQDAATLEPVLAGLKDAEARVRGEAAFAAGELALSWEPLLEAELSALEASLLAAAGTERDVDVRLTLVDALGRLGTPGAVSWLEERMREADGVEAARAAQALGVLARTRGAASVAQVSLAPAEALLAAERPVEARYAGAYLLATVKRPQALPALRRCLGDADADVRALCVKGFGDVGGPEDAVVLAALLEDSSPRVAAETARTLAKLAAACSGPCTAVDALEALAVRAKRVARGMPPPEAAGVEAPEGAKAPVETLARSEAGHALLALAQQGLPGFGRPVLESLRLALADAERGAASEVARADLAWLDCRLAAAMDRQEGTPKEVLGCGYGRIPEARRLALGLREVAQAKGQGGADFAVKALRHPDARVRLTALEAVSARPVPEAAAPVRELIEGEDLVVAGAAAATAGVLEDAAALPGVEALAARVLQTPGDLAEPVAGALVALQGAAAEPRLREWLQHPQANVRRVAAQALTRLTGQRVRSTRVALPAYTFRPPSAPARAGLVFRTDKGDITVRLDVEEAPLTSGNLHALARKGAFNGVTFHRVVPDFVAQGGDPRGDGEGGPGYSIRCEMTRRPYRRGTVGMALAGKDTGGSQFFFTHAPQPHLDGRYTAFGEVVSGMDVVDALLEGDVIREVRAVELSP